MDPRTLLHHILRAPAMYRTTLLPPSRPQTRTFALLTPHARFLSLPRIIQPSFWATMIPKPLKGGSTSTATPATTTAPRRREWNPATPYIILGLLVGSQAIQTLWLKQERGHNLRKAEAKMDLLREVIERVQRGEKVPVEKVLGTGVESVEKEWREVLDGLKNEESLFQNKKRRKALREEAALEEEKEEVKAEAEAAKQGDGRDAQVKVESIGKAKFY